MCNKWVRVRIKSDTRTVQTAFSCIPGGDLFIIIIILACVCETCGALPTKPGPITNSAGCHHMGQRNTLGIGISNKVCVCVYVTPEIHRTIKYSNESTDRIIISYDY